MMTDSLALVPVGIRVFTRHHRQERPPTLPELNDFEETLLFRSEVEEKEGESDDHTFWLFHEFDDCLWMLSVVPGLQEDESIVAWCKAPNELERMRIAELLLTEWLRSCVRNGKNSRVGIVTGGDEVSLEFDRVFRSARSNGDSPLHEAAWHDDVDLIEQLMSRGAPVDCRDHSGRTPLHYAAMQGRHSAAGMLLASGAQQSAFDNDGATPADIASEGGHGSVLSQRSSGRDVLLPHNTNDMRTPTKTHNGSSTSSGSSSGLVKQLLHRATRWHRRGEHLVARSLFERAAQRRDVSTSLTLRAVMGLFPCDYARGDVATMEQWLEGVLANEAYSSEVKARVLIECGRMSETHGDGDSAQRWFQRIVDLEGVSTSTVARARLHLANESDRNGDVESALSDLALILASSDVPTWVQARARLHRGRINYTEGRPSMAIDDFTWIADHCKSRPKLRALALIERSKCYEELREPRQVIADLTMAVDLQGCEPGDVAKSLHNYGVRCNLRGEPEKAYEYFLSVPDFGGKSVWIQTNAQVNRGCYLGDQGRLDEAIREFKLARATAEIPTDVLARAIYNLGNARRIQGNLRAAMRHFTTVIEMQSPPDGTLAASLAKRGICWNQLKKPEQGIRDLRRSLQTADADVDSMTEALLWLGICFHDLDDTAAAASHFQRLIDVPDASEEMHARARWGLGDVMADIGKMEDAARFLHEAREVMRSIGRDDLAQLIEASLESHGLNLHES